MMFLNFQDIKFFPNALLNDLNIYNKRIIKYKQYSCISFNIIVLLYYCIIVYLLILDKCSILIVVYKRLIAIII